MKSIRIREFAVPDAAGVQRVVHTVMAALRPDYDPHDPRNDDLERIPEVYGGDGKFWVATDGGRVIGTVAIRMEAPGNATVKRLFLLEEYRGNDIGKRLLRHALAHCRAKRVTEVTLITSTYATAARQLFRSAGFRETGKRFDFDPALLQYRLAVR